MIQSVGIGKVFGVRLPVGAGATFTVLSLMIVIAQKYGLAGLVIVVITRVFGGFVSQIAVLNQVKPGVHFARTR